MMASGSELAGEQVIAEDAVDRANTVLPTDFFSFLVGAPVIGNPDLEDPGQGAQFAQLGT